MADLQQAIAAATACRLAGSPLLDEAQAEFAQMQADVIADYMALGAAGGAQASLPPSPRRDVRVSPGRGSPQATSGDAHDTARAAAMAAAIAGDSQRCLAALQMTGSSDPSVALWVCLPSSHTPLPTLASHRAIGPCA